MKFSRRWKIIGAFFLAAIILGFIFVWNIGSVLVSPSNQPVGNPPANLKIETVEFPSASGALIHGWFVAGEPGRGAIVLLHGVHAHRQAMVGRAKFLTRAGYAVLLFDFQGHGESLGTNITFGFLESRDATAAVEFLRQKIPGEKIGVIGVSLGAASALLAEPPLPVNALVLESSFPTIYLATEDRLRERFGWLGRLATPLLTCQLQPRLGIRPADLQPVEHAKKITTPKLFIAGVMDKLTTIEESKAMFATAAEPKQCWWLDGAAHVDLHAFARAEYERRVGEFLAQHLK